MSLWRHVGPFIKCSLSSASVPQIYFLLSVRKGVVSAVLEPKFHGTILFSPGFANKTCDCVVKTHREAPGHLRSQADLRLSRAFPRQALYHISLLNSQTSPQDRGVGHIKADSILWRKVTFLLNYFGFRSEMSFHMFHVMQQVLNTVLLSQAFNHWF